MLSARNLPLPGAADLPLRLLRLPRLRRWPLVTAGLALLLAIPVLTIVGFLLHPSGEVWRHLAATLLGDYIINSLVLMIGVGVGTLVIGVACAWLTAACDFPGRRHFEWALLLPLAFPAYIIAYTYTGLLDVGGPVQGFIRDFTGLPYGGYWFPEVRSRGGAVVMLTLVLYPYVYLMARAAFLEQSVSVLEAGRTLGAGPWRSFFRLVLPLARPAVVTGVSLALMETLADFGTVQYFGVDTFTTGIFRTWFGLGDAPAAAQLSALLLGFVLLLLLLERHARRRARYHQTAGRYQRPARLRLGGLRGGLAVAACLLPVAIGFLLPLITLGRWALLEAHIDRAFLGLLWNSFSLAAGTALILLLVALLLGYGRRLAPGAVTATAVQLAGSGYAVPGTVIAVGVIIPFAWFDNALDSWLRARFGVGSGLLLSGSVAALLFAYTVRFLAVSLQAVEAGLGRIRPSMDEAARSLGQGPGAVLTRVHLPLMRGTLLSALLLCFVDVLKELPATLVLRPFNFNTLAVRTYELASDERLADASLSALAIVLAGVLPVMLLSRTIARSRPEQPHA